MNDKTYEFESLNDLEIDLVMVVHWRKRSLCRIEDSKT